MKKYHVAYTVLYSKLVEANTPEEAADMVAQTCPYDIADAPWVTELDEDDNVVEEGEVW